MNYKEADRFYSLSDRECQSKSNDPTKNPVGYSKTGPCYKENLIGNPINNPNELSFMYQILTIYQLSSIIQCFFS